MADGHSFCSPKFQNKKKMFYDVGYNKGRFLSFGVNLP